MVRVVKLVGVAVIAAAGVWLLGRAAGARLPALVGWVEGLGGWGPLALILTYTLATTLLVPGSVLTLAAGAIFGLGWGTLYAFVGATLGASAAFLVSRYLARPAVERRLRGDARFERIDRAVEGHGFRVTFLLRLSPAFPFSVINYALGLTRVRFADYLLASVGMLPGTLLYVYYGKVAGDVAAFAAGAEVERGAGYYLFLGIGLLATVALTVTVARLARRALREEEEAK